MSLALKVETVEFDTIAGVLRIKGRNMQENQHVKLGQYHTLELELNRTFTLYKAEWDTIALERIADACDVTKTADVAAIVLQEGLANVCLLTAHMTIVRQRVEMNIPKKRRGTSTDHDKALVRFYAQVYEALLRHVDVDVVKAVIIASPGFVKDHVYEYVFEQATQSDNKPLLKSRAKFLLVHASSGHKHALLEVLQDPTVKTRLADTKASREQRALDTFFETLSNDPERGYYGWKHVSLAQERGAINTLLVTDGLFRSAEIETRRKYVKLVEDVRKAGGNVYIFSSQHVTGEQLGQLTGIAAILNFSIPDLEEEEEEGEEGLVLDGEQVD
jgi:protein pelota